MRRHPPQAGPGPATADPQSRVSLEAVLYPLSCVGGHSDHDTYIPCGPYAVFVVYVGEKLGGVRDPGILCLTRHEIEPRRKIGISRPEVTRYDRAFGCCPGARRVRSPCVNSEEI